MSYAKTNRWFEWNKTRREQGRVPVACVWPDCKDHVMVREHAPSKNRQYVSYRIESGHFAGIVRYPICERHRALIYSTYGKGAKLNGIKAIIHGQDAEASTRVGGKLARLVIFDKTSGRCASCSVDLLFRDKWHADHIVPLFKGGLTKFSNLQALCQSCHKSKTIPEKREANALRYKDQRFWSTRHQMLTTISEQQKEIARLKTLLAQYCSEEEMAG